ncbi:MAG: hypothetical protein JXB32_21605 [Deltaproteobacteria bacterium]|nr:hypothetical protein [Deltaproteobacteria bacterium]
MARTFPVVSTDRRPALPRPARAGHIAGLLLPAILWATSGARAQPMPEDRPPDGPAAVAPAGPGPTAGPPTSGETAEVPAAEPPVDAPADTASVEPPGEGEPGRLLVRSAAAEVDGAALAGNLASRITGFEVSAIGEEVPEGVYLLEIEPGPEPARLRLLLRNPEGVAIVRELEVGAGAEAEDPSRFAAVVASHMVEELAVLERPPRPMPVPAAARPEPPARPGRGAPEPPPVEPEPAPPPEPPPAFELALFGGIQGNDLGGSPIGAGTGGTLFLRAAYTFLPWLGAALEAGWMGVTSNRVDVLLHAAPLRLGVDFGVHIPFLHASLGPRLAIDIWTAALSQRQTGSRYGGGLFGTVSLFPWERFGFTIAAAVDFFPVAVQLDAGGDPAFALGWVRFLFSGGIVGRI